MGMRGGGQAPRDAAVAVGAGHRPRRGVGQRVGSRAGLAGPPGARQRRILGADPGDAALARPGSSKPSTWPAQQRRVEVRQHPAVEDDRHDVGRHAGAPRDDRRRRRRWWRPAASAACARSPRRRRSARGARRRAATGRRAASAPRRRRRTSIGCQVDAQARDDLGHGRRARTRAREHATRDLGRARVARGRRGGDRRAGGVVDVAVAPAVDAQVQAGAAADVQQRDAAAAGRLDQRLQHRPQHGAAADLVGLRGARGDGVHERRARGAR